MSLHRRSKAEGQGYATGSQHADHELYSKVETLYQQASYKEGEKLLWQPVQQQEKTLGTEGTDIDLVQYWWQEYMQAEDLLRQNFLLEEGTSTPQIELEDRYALARLILDLVYLSGIYKTPVRKPSPLPRQHIHHVPSADNIEPISLDLRDHRKEFERLFTERPRGLSQKSAWLRQLKKERDMEWYREFYHWYIAKLSPPKAQGPEINISSEIFNVTRQASWQPTDLPLRNLTNFLSSAVISTTPDLYVGRYHDYNIGVVLNGSALDPPQTGIETFKLLHVQYAHLPMFAGLRSKELKDDLCLLILGNIYASTKKVPSDDDVWFDTRFVLALHAAHDGQKTEFLLVYKYEVYSTDYLDDGSEERSEEPEQEKPPRFCNRTDDAFTVAALETETRLLTKRELNDGRCWPSNMKLAVRSVRKPDLAVAGYVDDKHPYIAVLPPRDD